MESSFTTADFLALENRRDDYRHHGKGMAATGIGLAAGLGGGALLLAIAGLWGINKASEARSQGAMGLAAANAAGLGALSNAVLSERASRESWINANTPSIRQYVDVQSTPQVTTQSTSSAIADAYALAAAINNSGGINGAIATDSYLKVARYSAPSPCPCDTCGQ